MKSIAEELDNEIRQSLRHVEECTNATFYADLYEKYTPPKPVNRMRSWLGWKLWRLAAWINPDVIL